MLVPKHWKKGWENYRSGGCLFGAGHETIDAIGSVLGGKGRWMRRWWGDCQGVGLLLINSDERIVREEGVGVVGRV